MQTQAEPKLMAHGVIRFMAVLFLLAFRVEGLDTAGCMLHVRNFDQAKLTRVTWTAAIMQYEYIPDGARPFKIRIEFNSVGFGGSKGTTYIGAMIQNVGHSFRDDVAGRVADFPALGVYLSSLRSDFSDSSHGVRLNVDPAAYPKFGRVFENVDGLGYSAKNVYTRQNITPTSPNGPVRITWTVTRRSVVPNPVGNFRKLSITNGFP
jgi:hypothetical protein